MKRVILILIFAAAGDVSANGCEKIADCFAGRQGVKMIQDAFKRVDKKGKQFFGGDFKVKNRIRFSTKQKTIHGDVDAIVPFGGAFLQTGMTAWDSSKTGGRRDVRLGVVRRWTDAEKWYGGMLGGWIFAQMDSVDGGRRIFGGGEYKGKYGGMSANYYFGGGRMMAGGDYRFSLKPTSRFSLKGYVSHWKSRTDSAKYTTRGKIAAKYALREWLIFGGEMQRSSAGKQTRTATIEMKFVLGAKKIKRARRAPDYEKMRYSPVSRFKRMEYAAR